MNPFSSILEQIRGILLGSLLEQNKRIERKLNQLEDLMAKTRADFLAALDLLETKTTEETAEVLAAVTELQCS